MKSVKILIGDKAYTCKVATTEEDRKLGLQGVKSLPKDEGMLFVFDKPGTNSMWMKNTPIYLDLIFINDDDEVIGVYQGQPNDEKLVSFPHTKYVLEVNVDSDILVGDEMVIDDEEMDRFVMKVLAPDGTSQMNLLGGERIFSRKSTVQLIRWAKRAESSKDNPEEYNRLCKRLGLRMFKELHKLNTQQLEYVDVPENKDLQTDK